MMQGIRLVKGVGVNTLFEAILTAGLFLCLGTIQAQDSRYAIEKLNDRLYKLSYDAGGYDVKVIASVGSDGLLLVDTGDRQKAAALKAATQSLGYDTPDYIILTHEHIEHIGGAEIFGTEPTVIGHSSLRTVLKSRHFLFEEYTGATLPDITVDDTLTLRFNGEEIRIFSVPGSHSGSDLIVWFTGSAVACVAGLCNWPHYPSIDNTTGDVTRYPDAVKRVLDLLPENTKVIPGHGTDCTMGEFRSFHEMLVRTRDIVTGEIAKGKTVATLQQEGVLRDFKSYEGSYTSADHWIEYLAKGLQDRRHDNRKSIYEAMYYKLKEEGVDAAVAYYSRLRQNHPDEYDLDDKTPAIIGYLLFHQGKYPEAIGFMQLSLNEYPEGPYAGLSHKYLAKSYELTDDISQALKHYRRLLELDPSDTAAAAKIEELENRE